MARWLRWLGPANLVALGLAMTAVGFGYDLALAGLPYQDPTPEMRARWRYHSGVASVIELSGVATLLVGLAGLAIGGVWSLAARHAEPLSWDSELRENPPADGSSRRTT